MSLSDTLFGLELPATCVFPLYTSPDNEEKKEGESSPVLDKEGEYVLPMSRPVFGDVVLMMLLMTEYSIFTASDWKLWRESCKLDNREFGSLRSCWSGFPE